MKMRDRPERARETGASLVEFALLAPLLFSILLGTITAGLALAEKNSITNAVREGARLGATLPEGTGWSADWADDVQKRVVALSGGDASAEEICVQIVDASDGSILGDYTGADCPTANVPDTPDSASTGCVVKVWARSFAELETIFFSRDVTLDANAVGLYERDECP